MIPRNRRKQEEETKEANLPLDQPKLMKKLSVNKKGPADLRLDTDFEELDLPSNV